MRAASFVRMVLLILSILASISESRAAYSGTMEQDENVLVDFFVSDPQFQKGVEHYADRILQNTPSTLPQVAPQFWIQNKQGIYDKVSGYKRKTVEDGVRYIAASMTPSDLDELANWLKDPLCKKWVGFEREFNTLVMNGKASPADEASFISRNFTNEEADRMSTVAQSNGLKIFQEVLSRMATKLGQDSPGQDDANWRDFLNWVRETAGKEGLIR